MPKLLVTLPHVGDLTHDLTGDVITIGCSPENRVQIEHESIAPFHGGIL